VADGVKTTLALTLSPEMADAFCATFAAMVPATREFPGCRSVTGYRNLDEPNRFILIGEWESKADYQKYLAWRHETSSANPGSNPMMAPPKLDFWTIVEE
jgi:quinol monooxygenase YgiN